MASSASAIPPASVSMCAASDSSARLPVHSAPTTSMAMKADVSASAQLRFFWCRAAAVPAGLSGTVLACVVSFIRCILREVSLSLSAIQFVAAFAKALCFR